MPDSSPADDLYRLDPDQFTAARNALAKSLRTAGDRAEADRVSHLRRPSVTAWALNQVARRQPSLIDAVLAAGGGLRAAMERALEGDASTLRDAQAAERRAVDAAVVAAIGHLRDNGNAASDTARMRLAGTLRAAVIEDTVADQLRAGVTDHDHDAPGFGLDASSVPVASTHRPGPPAPEVRPAAEGDRQRRARRAELEAEAKQLARRAHRLEDHADQAQQRAAKARVAADEAAAAAVEARAAADEAAAAAEAARLSLDDEHLS